MTTKKWMFLLAVALLLAANVAAIDCSFLHTFVVPVTLATLMGRANASDLHLLRGHLEKEDGKDYFAHSNESAAAAKESQWWPQRAEDMAEQKPEQKLHYTIATESPGDVSFLEARTVAVGKKNMVGNIRGLAKIDSLRQQRKANFFHPKRGKKCVKICHFDEESGAYRLIRIRKKSHKAHLASHRQDFVPVSGSACAQANTVAPFWNIIDTVDSPSEALSSIDPQDLNAFVELVRSQVSDELRSLITAESVINIMYPNPNAVLNVSDLDEENSDAANQGGRRALALHEPSSALAARNLGVVEDVLKGYPPGCPVAFISFVIGIVAVFLTFLKLKNAYAIAEPTVKALFLNAVPTQPMILNFFALAKIAYLKGNKTKMLGYIYTVLSNMANFYGVKMLAKAIYSNLTGTDVAIGLFSLVLSMVALFLTDGVSLLAEVLFLTVAITTAIISGLTFFEKCFPPNNNCGAKPTCDDGDKCTTDTSVCNNGKWICSNTPKLCAPDSSCDLADGQCKADNDLVPCVAVIDEDSEFGSPNQATLWTNFRTVFPGRPFCLLVPNPEGSVEIPQNFQADDYTVTHFNIPRDNGDASKASDWVSSCGLNKYTSANVGWVGLFVDDSGSMKATQVKASYDKFVSSLQSIGIQVKEVVNSDENWILPFMTTLVPLPTCTGAGKAGVCLLDTKCALEYKKSVPWESGDPEPSCRNLPSEYKCCVTYDCTGAGKAGECLLNTECVQQGKTSVPWESGDPEPSCRTLPTEYQCCVDQ